MTLVNQNLCKPWQRAHIDVSMSEMVRYVRPLHLKKADAFASWKYLVDKLEYILKTRSRICVGMEHKATLQNSNTYCGMYVVAVALRSIFTHFALAATAIRYYYNWKFDRNEFILL